MINCDRRGRGDSGDTAPYAAAREVEDLEALIEARAARPTSSGSPPVGRSRSTRRPPRRASARSRCTSPRSWWLVGHGEKTDPRLEKAARAVAAVVPGAELRTLPGQRHDVKPEALVPALLEFFAA